MNIRLQYYVSFILLACLAFSIIQMSMAGISHAQPVDFCNPKVDSTGQFSYRDGGGLLNSNLPSQFLSPEQKKYLSFGDNDPLNTFLYTLKPAIMRTGTNCSTDLRGISINPGATTINSDTANYGVKVGTNAAGFSAIDTQQLLLNGIRFGSNSGFTGNR